MESKHHKTLKRFGVDALLALSTILLLLHFGCIWGKAAGSETLPTPVSRNFKNYFKKDVDKETLRVVMEVEKYHLGNTFWNNYRGRDMHAAADDMKFILRYVPNHPKALLLLSGIGKITGAPSMASPYFQTALKLFPEEALTNAQFGNFLLELAQVEEGIVFLKKAVNIDPKLAVAYGWLAVAYQKKGNTVLATEAMEKARELGYKGGHTE